MVRWARRWRWIIALAAAIAAFTTATDLLLASGRPWWGLIVSAAYGTCLLFLLGRARRMPE